MLYAPSCKMVAGHAVILGAGISGLAAAWYLRSMYGPSIKITIIEKTECAGGWIRSVVHDGFLFEQGPHSCRASGDGIDTLHLIQDLGIRNKVLPADPAARKRYLYLGKKLRKIPHSFASVASSPWFWPVLPRLVREAFAVSKANEEETVAAFFERKFGSFVSETFADPMVSGIYAGDMHRLSLKSCFPKVYEWEKSKGSVIRGAFGSPPPSYPDPWMRAVLRSGMFTLEGGLETLPKTLASNLDADILFQTEAAAIRPKGSIVEVALQDRVLEADWLVSALPAQPLADLTDSLSSRCSQLLRSIPYASAAVVHLGYKKKTLHRKGFGHLVPKKEKEQALGVIWDSEAFPQLNRHPEETRLAVMFPHPLKNSKSTEDYIDMALKTALSHLQIRRLPDTILCEIARDAIPQYIVGHEDSVRGIKQELYALSPKIRIIGNTFCGPGINDCIAGAKRCAESLQTAC